MPSFSVYRGAITPWTRDPEPGQLIFLRIDKLDDLAASHPGARLRQYYRRGAVALVSIEAADDG
jgi:hypothetical protein